ncbi:MAG: L-lactate dehydrogenase [Clostridiales bacterium]|nr:L-lactate dehydrogenase [Clostridiales bacterium]
MLLIKGKIAIIGSGFVGSTTAYTLFLSGLINEIVLVDVNRNKAEGDAMDLNHGLPFVSPVKVTAGDYSLIKDCDMVIITAGANQKEGETRIDLLKRNYVIFKSIVDEIVKYCTDDTILMVVSNPVDILTYVTYKLSGFSKRKVFGSGTVLDTARLKYIIGEHTNIDARNVHTYIIGEHGDSEVPTWSLTRLAGLTIEDYCLKCGSCDDINCCKDDFYHETKNAAYEIISKKGATYYAIALAVRRICEAIIGDENSILPLSGVFEGEYGIKDICLSVPTVVNANGASRILELPFSDVEIAALKNSSETLKGYCKELGL